MGFSTLSSQALSAPPYLASFLIVLLAAWQSDKHQSRSLFIIAFALFATSGNIVLLLPLPNTIRYLAVTPACVGFFTCVTLIITWTLNNQESDGKKGTGIALLQYLGQCGPLLGTRLFPDEDGPLFSRGLAVCAACMVGVAVLAGFLRVVLAWENRRRLEEWRSGDDSGAFGREHDMRESLMRHEDGNDGIVERRKGLFIYML